MIPTVRIKRDTPKGYAIINESDFDPKRHTLYNPEPAPAPEKPKKAKRQA